MALTSIILSPVYLMKMFKVSIMVKTVRYSNKMVFWPGMRMIKAFVKVNDRDRVCYCFSSGIRTR